MTNDLDNSAEAAPTPAPPLVVKLKVWEAAKASQVNVRTVYRWLIDGKIKSCAGPEEDVRILLSDLSPDAQTRWASSKIGLPNTEPKAKLSNGSPQLILPGLDDPPDLREAILMLQPSQRGPVMGRFRAIQQLTNHDSTVLGVGRMELTRCLAPQLGISQRQLRRLCAEYERVRKQDGTVAAIESLKRNSPGPDKWAGSSLDPSNEQGRSLMAKIAESWEFLHLTRTQICHEIHNYVQIKQRGTASSYIYEDPTDKAIIRFINLAPPYGLGGDANPRRNGPEALREAAGYIDCTYDDEFAGDTWCIDEWECDGAFYNAAKHREIFWSIYLVSLVDERSTRILDSIVAYRLNIATVLDLLERAVRAYGPPLYLRSDRGGHFRGKVIGRRVVQPHGKLIKHALGALGQLGVTAVLPRDKNPRADRIERMHRIYSDRAQRDFGPSWRGRNTEERPMTDIDERVARHVQEHCKKGTSGPLILSTADLERIVAAWMEEINLADTDAHGCQGMSRLAAFNQFQPPAEELARRRALATPELIDIAFAEHDERVIRAGGVIEWRDGLRYSAPLLCDYQGEKLPMLRYRRDTSRIIVEIDRATIVAERRIPVGRNDPERCAEENRKLNHQRKLMARSRDFGELSEVPLAAEAEAAKPREIGSTEWMAEHRREIPEPPVQGVGFADLE